MVCQRKNGGRGEAELEKDRSSSRNSRHRNRVGSDRGGRMDQVRRTNARFPRHGDGEEIAECGGDDAAFGIGADADGGWNTERFVFYEIPARALRCAAGIFSAANDWCPRF